MEPDELLKQATNKKKSGDLETAIGLLRHAYKEIGKGTVAYPVKTFLRLPAYLQEAGKGDEAWRELNNLLTKGYPNQSKDPLMILIDRSSIYDGMRLFLQREGKNAYERNIGELLDTIQACLKSRLVLPGLLLLYAGIDILAWLNRTKSHADSKPDDFIEWVDRYLLPDTGLACSASDLYAARCSLLHSYTAESRRSREGMARQIFYAWGTGRVEALQQLILYVGTHSAVAVHTDDLFGAFRVGVQRFKQALSNNPAQANLVYERAGKFFANLLVQKSSQDFRPDGNKNQKTSTK